MQEQMSSTTRRLNNGRIQEKVICVREYDSAEEYERANGVRLNNVNSADLAAAIDEYVRNVTNLMW